MKKLIIIALFCGCTASVAQASTNEISVNVNLSVKKDAISLARNTDTVRIQMAGNLYSVQTLTLTTTNQFMVKGAIGNAGMCYMRNLSTNAAAQANITFDRGTTTGIVLKAQEPAIFRIKADAAVTNFTGSASVGTVNFEMTIIED
jgi:hypothetical protein